MSTSIIQRVSTEGVSPLEQFLRDYVAAREGEWDEIEPRVSDVLIDQDVMRLAFDPEALPEHPEAQLAAFGSPVVDRLLKDAASRWNSCACYRGGLRLSPYNLAGQVARAIDVTNGAIELQRTRAMYFPQALFWFKATFCSDQKEEVMLPIGMDLHQMREVRQLDGLLAFERLSDEPEALMPEAPHRGLMAGYCQAKAHVERSIAPLANARRRDWSGSVQKQIARMRGYYARLREEALADTSRAADLAAIERRKQERRQSIDGEEQLRIMELQRKSEMRVEVRLTNVLTIYQPKLLLFCSVLPKSGSVLPLQLVWDALSDTIEPAICARCGQPTYQVLVERQGLTCPQCPTKR